jgi:hypothetical protein
MANRLDDPKPLHELGFGGVILGKIACQMSQLKVLWPIACRVAIYAVRRRLKELIAWWKAHQPSAKGTY